MGNTFDFFDLVDVPDKLLPTASAASDTPPWEEQAQPLKQWADDTLAAKPVSLSKPRETAQPVFVDIETGPRPWEEIEHFFKPPERPGEFDPSTMKYGNLKDEAKRAEKLAAAKATHNALVENYEASVEAAKQEFLASAALSPITGRVLLIGVQIGQGDPVPLDFDDEREILNRFWDLVVATLEDKAPVIGHNSRGFDLPFIVRRSWLLGVDVPREIRQGRYWSPLFRDTMEWWACGARDFTKLNTIAEFFGCGQKTEGVSGKDFAKLWHGQMPTETWGTPEEQRLKAIEYNAQDIRLTAAIAAKMGML